jgi:hypothetical protein
MKIKNRKLSGGIFLLFLFILSLPNPMLSRDENENEQSLKALLPVLEGLVSAEAPQTYYPENLFEYINGAAEIYLSYGFKELIVAEYKKSDTSDTTAVEIYDMGDHKNSFGIYSAERYPDNEFVSLGTQGYVEEGALNFLVGRYYIKLLCFDCEDRSDKTLQAFSEEIVSRVEDKGGFPVLLNAFPMEGRLPNSEKYILNNFMGYRFLHDGYLANYEVDGLSFDCFLIEGENPDEAQIMLQQYLEAKGASNVQKISSGYQIKDRYYHNIYLDLVKNYICGVMKIKEGKEKVGEKYLENLVKQAKRLDS